MRDILNLDDYPLDQPGTAAWTALVARCQADLDRARLCDPLGIHENRPALRTLHEGILRHAERIARRADRHHQGD